MSVATIARPSRSQVPLFGIDRIHRFSVEQYHQLIAIGILTKDDRVELLEGWIVKKMSQNPPHRASVERVMRRLARVLPDDWNLSCQGPITLSDSEPEPDLAIARGGEGTYDDRHPGPEDIAVLIEVADTSLADDRRYKGELYAREKIAEFWLIDLVNRKIEVGTRPRGDKYQKVVEYSERELIPLVLDRQKIAELPVASLIAKS
jgi:hypothetical protein